MKVINHGNTYNIFPSDVKVHDKLPSGTYRINFDPMSGYSLTKHVDIIPAETRVYGTHSTRINKLKNAYAAMNRSMGVILSGDKGMGKSLFLQLTSKAFNDIEIPTIICDQATPGLANYIDSIEQDVVVLFDEFEKVFNEDSQTDLLGLFDGTSHQKRLYMVTVNETNRVSQYMFDRPGRFHYHIQFEYPTAEEATEYLHDNVKPEYHHKIDDVVRLITYAPLNYDCLRAIVFELNLGETLKSAIQDLNISASTTSYGILTAIDHQGRRYTSGTNVDLAGVERQYELFGLNNKETVNIDIKTPTVPFTFQPEKGVYTLNDVNIWYYENDDDYEDSKEKAKTDKPPLSKELAEKLNLPDYGIVQVEFKPSVTSYAKVLL